MTRPYAKRTYYSTPEERRQRQNMLRLERRERRLKKRARQVYPPSPYMDEIRELWRQREGR